MILMDLLPPGLTFQDLVGPSGGTLSPSPSLVQGLRSNGLEVGTFMKRMGAIDENGLLQRYVTSEQEVATCSTIANSGQANIAKLMFPVLVATSELA
jgi:hypothetical protein